MKTRKIGIPCFLAMCIGCGNSAEMGAQGVDPAVAPGGIAKQSEGAPRRFSEEAKPGRRGPVRSGVLHTESGDRQVSYQEIDGEAVIEGDIVFPLSAFAENGAINSIGALKSTSGRWPNGRVYYDFDAGLSSAARSDAQDAIAHWTEKSNIQFIPRGTETNFVRFVDGAGCSSRVGMYSGRQNIELNKDCGFGAAVHEIGHTLGFWHEQSRNDRDNYVTINWDNIEAGYEENFEKSGSFGFEIGEYDYGSIMHYGSHEFSKNGSPTIVSKTAGVTLGQRNGLSDRDIAGIQVLYNGVLDVSASVDSTWGGYNEGGGMALTNLDGDARPDAVMVRMDAGSGANTLSYRVAWNIDRYNLTNGGGAFTYRASSYGPPNGYDGGGTSFGDSTSGLGAAIADINGNGRPDLVVVYVDNPSGQDVTYYRIGWDLSTSGVVSSWSGRMTFLGLRNGDHTGGVDVAIADINNNGKLDMVVAKADDPDGENMITYGAGFDMTTSGTFKSITIAAAPKAGWVGSSTADVGLDIADMDGNGKLDIVITWADAPGGDDRLYMQVGYDLKHPCIAGTWGPIRLLGTRLGETTNGTDIAVRDFDGDGSLDIMTFHLDRAGGGNTGYTYAGFGFSDAVYTMTAKHSGKLVDVSGVSVSDGAPIHQWSATGADNQKFTFARTDDGYYNLIAKHSGRCIDIKDVSLADGAPAHQWGCGVADNQKFSLLPQADGTFMLRAKHSGKCLDVKDFSTADGGIIHQWTCNGTDNQKFTLTKITS